MGYHAASIVSIPQRSDFNETYLAVDEGAVYLVSIPQRSDFNSYSDNEPERGFTVSIPQRSDFNVLPDVTECPIIYVSIPQRSDFNENAEYPDPKKEAPFQSLKGLILTFCPC